MKKSGGRSQKTKKSAIISVLFLIFLLVASAANADLVSEARSMLSMINDFRTGSNAWYWNADNVTYTTESGLGTLQYDTTLEEVAQVRAQEIASSFSHTRPDGSDWSTAYPAGNYYKAENIAYGYRTAEAAFNAFLEEDENYAGQGHRRIMLWRNVTRVGIAVVEVNGTRYWVQEFASDGIDGSGSTSGWVCYAGKYYYRNADGSLAKGWLKDGENWYLLNNRGVMLTGLQKNGQDWYYLDASGAMQTGWQKIKNNWYYFDDSGAMQTGWKAIGSKWYYFDTSGVMQTGWQNIGGYWYYMKDSGAMQTGWQKIGSSWYYMRSTGEMVTGTVTIDGQREIFGTDGAWQYSEINDYDTPLGTMVPIRWIRMIIQFLQGLF